MLSACMRAARPARGGLLAPGRRARSACDLLVHPGGVDLTAPGASVHLPFDDCAADGENVWLLTRWAYGRGGDIGVGVFGAGTYAGAIADLRKRRRTLMGAVNRWGDHLNVAPLDAAGTINLRVDADRDSLQVLLRRLADEPSWRPQLADAGRVGQLLRDMDGVDHGAVPAVVGVRRRTVEALIAMQQLGFVHAVQGRPMPDDRRPAAEAVIDAVVRRLAANPYGMPVDEEAVSAVVHRRYLDVRAWPFRALMPEDTWSVPEDCWP